MTLAIILESTIHSGNHKKSGNKGSSMEKETEWKEPVLGLLFGGIIVSVMFFGINLAMRIGTPPEAKPGALHETQIVQANVLHDQQRAEKRAAEEKQKAEKRAAEEKAWQDDLARLQKLREEEDAEYRQRLKFEEKERNERARRYQVEEQAQQERLRRETEERARQEKLRYEYAEKLQIETAQKSRESKDLEEKKRKSDLAKTKYEELRIQRYQRAKEQLAKGNPEALSKLADDYVGNRLEIVHGTYSLGKLSQVSALEIWLLFDEELWQETNHVVAVAGDYMPDGRTTHREAWNAFKATIDLHYRGR